MVSYPRVKQAQSKTSTDYPKVKHSKRQAVTYPEVNRTQTYHKVKRTVSYPKVKQAQTETTPK